MLLSCRHCPGCTITEHRADQRRLLTTDVATTFCPQPLPPAIAALPPICFIHTAMNRQGTSHQQTHSHLWHRVNARALLAAPRGATCSAIPARPPHDHSLTIPGVGTQQSLRTVSGNSFLPSQPSATSRNPPKANSRLLNGKIGIHPPFAHLRTTAYGIQPGIQDGAPTCLWRLLVSQISRRALVQGPTLPKP